MIAFVPPHAAYIRIGRTPERNNFHNSSKCIFNVTFYVNITSIYVHEINLYINFIDPSLIVFAKHNGEAHEISRSVSSNSLSFTQPETGVVLIKNRARNLTNNSYKARLDIVRLPLHQSSPRRSPFRKLQTGKTSFPFANRSRIRKAYNPPVTQYARTHGQSVRIRSDFRTLYGPLIRYPFVDVASCEINRENERFHDQKDAKRLAGF